MVKTPIDVEALADDGDEDINGNGNPDLGLDCILARAIEGLDPKMLFDPFEEEFNLPSRLVDLSDGERGQREVVGQELQPLVRLGVEVADAPQRIGIGFGGLDCGEDDRLVGSQPCGLVHRTGVPALQDGVLLGTHNKECGTEREEKESLEIDIRAIHDVEGARFGCDFIGSVSV